MCELPGEIRAGEGKAIMLPSPAQISPPCRKVITISLLELHEDHAKFKLRLDCGHTTTFIAVPGQGFPLHARCEYWGEGR